MYKIPVFLQKKGYNPKERAHILEIIFIEPILSLYLTTTRRLHETRDYWDEVSLKRYLTAKCY